MMKLKHFVMTGVILFSSFIQAEQLTHGDQSIDIQYASNLTKNQKAKIQKWLNDVTQSLLTVYGVWPKDEFIIKVRTTSRYRGPVPWGQVTRSSYYDSDRVDLVINPTYSYQNFIDDWTVFHELSHLFIPYQGYGDLWLSEGIASYYQNIIRARGGFISEIDLWDKMVAGFNRGAKDQNHSDVPLHIVSEHKRKYRSFMRVYWSGVLYWLTVDVKIRKQSKNKISLDSLLLKLKNCCENRDMSARQIVRKLDQLATSDLFYKEYLQFRNSYSIPDYLNLIGKLGIYPISDSVKLDNNQPDSKIRIQIYQGNKQ